MKTASKIFSLIFIGLFMNSCAFLNDHDRFAPYDEATKTYEQKDFDQLDMGSSFHVVVKKASTFRVKVTGDKQDIEDLILRNFNGSLKIYYSSWRITRHRMDIEIDMPSLKRADFSGASVSTISDFGNANDLKINLSGASRSILDGGFKNYLVDISGASVLELNGSTQSVDAEISGASNLNAFSLKTEDAYVNISGASKAKVDVNKLLKVDASGASSVYYRGNPKLESKTSGASKVEKD